MEGIAKQLFFLEVPTEASIGCNSRSVIEVTNGDTNICDKETLIFLKFTLKELKLAGDRLNNKKAPGPGLIPPEVIKALAKESLRMC